MKYIITVEGETFEIEIGRGGMVWVNQRPYSVDFQGVDGRPEYSLLVDHRSYETHIEEADGDECKMVVSGHPYQAHLQARGRRPSQDNHFRLQPSDEGKVCAPLPGLLVELPITVGQRVKRGDVVAVLESMKMNLELCAPNDGVVQALHGTIKAQVSQGQVLAVIGQDGAPGPAGPNP